MDLNNLFTNNSNGIDNMNMNINNSLLQGKLFGKEKNGYQHISKIVVPTIKEGNRASGIDSGIISNSNEINDAVKQFNQKLEQYNSISNEYNSLFKEYVTALKDNYSTNISDRGTGMWEKRTEFCYHAAHDGWYKTINGLDVPECLKKCEDDSECRGVSYSGDTIHNVSKWCVFFKSTCEAGNAGDIGMAQEMNHYSGTIDHLPKCSWEKLNQIYGQVGRNNKTIESEQLAKGCHIKPCSAGAIKHIDNHKIWNEQQGQLAHTCYIKDRPPWKNNGASQWANFNKTNKKQYCGPYPGDDKCRSDDRTDRCFPTKDVTECKLACAEDPNCKQISYDKNRKWCIKCNNLDDIKKHNSWDTYIVSPNTNAKEKRIKLKEMNKQLTDLTYDLNNQIDIMLDNDGSLQSVVGNQQKQLRDSVKHLERERDSLDDSRKYLDANTMNGLYTDSVLRRDSSKTGFLAWGFFSAAIIGISLYQIKKVRD